MLAKFAAAIKREDFSPRMLICAAGIVLWCVAVVIVLHRLYVGARGGPVEWGLWPLSEWLINYGGGFERRGLAGALIHLVVGGKTAVPFISGMLFCVFLTFTALLLALVMFCKPAGKSLVIILLAPGSLVAMATANVFYDRKEILFHASLALLALLFVFAARTADQSVRLRLLIAAAVSSAISFAVLPIVHEAFLFLSAPAHVAVLCSAAIAFDKPWLRRLALGLACIAACQFVIACIWHGDPQTAQAIWDSLAAEDQSRLLPVGASANPKQAIAGIGWSVRQGVALPLSFFTDGSVWYWLVPLALSLGSLLLLGFALDGTPAGFKKAATVWTALFAASLPVYVLGWDWGRWISILSIQASTVFCACHAIGEWSVWRPLQFRFLEKIALPTGVVFFWFFMAAETTFHMPVCCLMRNPGSLLYFVTNVLAP
jgi:hypothetical protein